jgi:hypothetical protein
MFDKPYIAHMYQDGYPPYPYVENAYSFVNMIFRSKEVDVLHAECSRIIKAAKDEILRTQIREVLQEELAKIK